MTASTRRSIEALKQGLSLPLIAAPMFLVSSPSLVIESCRAGVIGSFPSLNARTTGDLDAWLAEITSTLAASAVDTLWAINLIVHRSNERFAEDLELTVKYRAPIVISALGSPRAIIDAVHGYGGLVFADVNSVAFARKAAEAGADGLILVAAGAGGHTGHMTGFSFVPAVREFFAGPIVLAGGIVDGRGVRAAEVLGADLAYMGTRFIATRESLASDAYRQMLVAGTIEDIVLSPFFTGVPANYLLPSIVQAGIDPRELGKANPQISFDNPDARAKAWKDIWSAGQGVGAVHAVQSVAELVAELRQGYDAVA
jgi:nitronate monooxygenase